MSFLSIATIMFLSIDTIIRDYRDPAAYLEWNMKAGPTKNKKDFLQISFRTRQTNGMLFFAQSETTMERFFLEVSYLCLN